jgi:hypothetical protein
MAVRVLSTFCQCPVDGQPLAGLDACAVPAWHPCLGGAQRADERRGPGRGQPDRPGRRPAPDDRPPVGESTLLASLAIQDIEAGDGLALIDPKGDLVRDVLARIPERRRDDGIVLDPADIARPIGLNVLGLGEGEQGRELAADFVLSVLHSLCAQYWGPRTDDILRTALLTLTHTKALDGSPFTLVEIPELLTSRPLRMFRSFEPQTSCIACKRPLTVLSLPAGQQPLSKSDHAGEQNRNSLRHAPSSTHGLRAYPAQRPTV